MKKLLFCLLTVIVISTISVIIYSFKRDCDRQFPSYESTEFCGISNLDHDILIPNTSLICDEVLTGFDTTVGPTGWPWTDPVKWEVALYEDNSNYYARLIFHEYCLWWSWDDPYIVARIPKANVGGDLRQNEKLRWQVLWNITHTTLREYDYKPYMPNSIVQKINGHTVSFGNYSCKYEKYFVICDQSNVW